MTIQTHDIGGTGILRDADLLATDVLILGGGPAGTWAALAAAAHGASVILADKGWCGTSGATAPSNTGSWYIPPGPARETEAEKRLAKAEGLADRRWILRTIDQSHRDIDGLAADGYPFPIDEEGRPYRANLRGPDYMRFMRRRVELAKVRVLDHSPALELLWSDGVVAGAAGRDLRSGRNWIARAGAVVIATGGCAFLSRALGCDGNTGDGLLMAAEAGARLSGMEFSAQYGVSALNSSVTKGLAFMFASFTLEDGSPLPEGGDRVSRIARALVAGHRVFARMDRGDARGHDWLRRGQPNCFLPFDRAGIDPVAQRFEVTLRSEGTVRGVGGLDLTGDDCATSVPGLYAAGDAATRENIAGAVSGGGSPNAAWAIATGTWSGAAAARFAAAIGDRKGSRRIQALGGAGVRPLRQADGLDRAELTRAVQAETLPLDVNYFRSGPRIAQSLARLDGVWRHLRDHAGGVGQASGREGVRLRELAAMTATARWIWASAEQRTESRGLHRRTDLTVADPRLARRIHSGGTDAVWAGVETSDWGATAS